MTSLTLMLHFWDRSGFIGLFQLKLRQVKRCLKTNLPLGVTCVMMWQRGDFLLTKQSVLSARGLLLMRLSQQLRFGHATVRGVPVCCGLDCCSKNSSVFQYLLAESRVFRFRFLKNGSGSAFVWRTPDGWCCFPRGEGSRHLVETPF